MSGKMQRRKIGDIIVKCDTLDKPLKKAIWSNVWSYDNKIWFGAFFNTKAFHIFDKFTPYLTEVGFKKKEIYSEYGNYIKFQITGTQEIFDALLENMNDKEFEITQHTSNGIISYKLKINIKEYSNYVYNEKVIDAL